MISLLVGGAIFALFHSINASDKWLCSHNSRCAKVCNQEEGTSVKEKKKCARDVATVFTCIVRMFIIAIKEWHRTVALMFSHETHQLANGSLMVSKFPVLFVLPFASFVH